MRQNRTHLKWDHNTERKEKMKNKKKKKRMLTKMELITNY